MAAMMKLALSLLVMAAKLF